MHKLYLKSYKKEFKSYILKHKEQSVFSTISITPSELYTNSNRIIWEDEYKEVVYKGILYDVVSVKSKGVTVELMVVSDHQEMQLKKEFASLYDISSSQKTKGPFDLLKNFFALKYIVSNTELEFKNPMVCNNNSFQTQLFQIVTRTIHAESPPPDFIG